MGSVSAFRRRTRERTREEHVAACKARALAILEAGEPTRAAREMIAGLREHPETWGLVFDPLGLYDLGDFNPAEVRPFIERFS